MWRSLPIVSGCRLVAALAFAFVATAVAPREAAAQLVTWNVTTGTWATTSSWLGGAVPATTGTAVFSGTSVGAQNIAVLLSGSTTIGGLSFTNTGTATLRSDSTTTQTLTLGTGGITMSSTAGPVTIGASGSAVNILLSAAQTWTNNSLRSPLSILGTIDTAASTNALLTINTAGTTSLAGDIIGGTGRVISLVKSGSGTLVLGGNNTAMSGTVGISAGILRMGSNTALGTGTTTVSSGATLDLNGYSTGVPLSVAGSGLSGAWQANTLGALINSSTTSASTVSGTVTLAAATSIGGMGLGYTRPNTGAVTAPTAGAGDITISGPVSGAFAFTKVGDNRLFITGSAGYAGATVVNNGSLVLAGSGVLWNQTGITVNPNAALVFDNSAGFATVNRSGTVASRPITLNAGRLNLFGNASVSGTESLGTGSLTPSSGFNVVTLSGSASTGLVLSAATITYAANGNVLVRGNNLGAGVPGPGTSNVILTTAPTTHGQSGADGSRNKAISPWAIVDQSAVGSGTSFMAYSASTGVRPLASNEYDQVTSLSSATNNNNWYLSQAVSGAAGQDVGPNSLTLQGSASLALGANSILSPKSSGILAYGTNNEIGGGLGFIAPLPNQALFVAVAGANSRLTISSPIGYGSSGGGNIPNAINKSGDGELVLSAKGFLPRPLYLNSGTVTLAGGANTLAFNVSLPPAASATSPSQPATPSALYVSSGGVLDLNGNNQAVGGLFGNANSTALPGSGGVVTNSSATAATLTVVQQAAATFAGSITGNLGFTRVGGNSSLTVGTGVLTMTAPNTFTGPTVVAGQRVTLQDLGTFENTSKVTIVGVPLVWNDTGLAAVSNRLPATVPIDLLGGSLNWLSRADLTSAISTGTVTPVRGNSILRVATTGNGSPTMTVAALGPRSMGATLMFAGSGTLGYGGTNPTILVTANPSVTSGIVGGWAVTNGANESGNNGSFVTYDPVLGIRPLALTSYVTSFSQIASGVNFRTDAFSSGTFNAGTNVANSLTMGGLSNLTFASANDTLNLQSGGIVLQMRGGNGEPPLTLGGAPGVGRITAGGVTASSGTRELFINQIGTHSSYNFTLNASVIDNPAGAAVALVYGGISIARPMVLTGSNSYSGGTYVNSTAGLRLSSTAGGYAIPGDLYVTGGIDPTDDTASNQTSIQWLAANQMAPTGAISIRGGAWIDLNGFSNSIAGLTFVNDTQGVGNIPPALLTSTGTLTLTGPIAVPNPSQPYLIPLIAGNLDLGGGSRTMTVDSVAAVPEQIGLAINAGLRNGSLVSTGSGVVFLGGVSGSVSYTGNAGTLVLGNTGFLGGRVTLGSAATLDMRGGSFTIGSLAGSGTVTNNVTYSGPGGSSNPGTLTFGVDNTTTTFSGVFTNFVNTLPGTLTTMPLNLTKIGTGTTAVTGVSTVVDTGTFTIAQGGVTLSGSGASSFNAVAVNAGGTLVLDNSSTAVNNRLGGPTLLNAATARGAVTVGGGLRIVGNAAAAVSETVATLQPGNGGSLVTFDAAGTQGVTLTATTLGANVSVPVATMVVRGITGTTGAGAGTLSVTTFNGSGGGGAAGSQTMTIRPDILVDPNPAGLGTGFAVRDPSTGLVRAIAATELSGTLGAAGTTGNYGFSTLQSATASQTVNSLTLNAGGGVAAGSVNSQLTITSGGILAFAGNTGLGIGRITTNSGNPMVFHTPGTGTLGLNGSIVGTTYGGIAKAGDGTLVLGSRQYYNGEQNAAYYGTVINGGTLRLAAGDNTILVRTTSAAATPTLIGLFANGGTFDLNGSTQLVERLQSWGAVLASSGVPGTGGAISGTAGSRLVSVASTSTTFAGTITGGVEFQKAGTGVLTMVSGNDTTGAVVVRGPVTLRDSGAFSAASSVTVNQATLTLDDTGLSANSTRLGTAPVSLNGGSLTFNSRQSTAATGTISSLALAGGQSTITLTTPSGMSTNGSSLDFVVSSLTRPAGSAVVNFAVTTGTLGQPGPNPRLTLTGATNTNGILGGWAVANANNWATVNAQGAVGGLGDTGFNAFSANLITGTTNDASMNLYDVNTNRTGIPTQTINSFRGGQATYTLATSSTLTLASGGLMSIGNASPMQFPNVAGSALTSGTNNLFAFTASGATLNLGLRVADGATAIGLVKSGPGTLTLSSTANTYSGTTFVNAGTLQLSSANGGVMVPGNLVIAGNGAAVTMTATSGQILSTSRVSIIGGGTLTPFGTNTLAGLDFDNLGGGTTPTVNTAAQLILSASNAITASNDNPAFTPTISGTLLSFLSATPTITTSGLSPLDLLISATISSAGGPITKAGAGSLVLNAANTFSQGFNLSAGSILVDNASALGSGTLTFSGGGNLQSLSAVRTIANPVSVAGDFSLGGSTSTNDIALSGTVTVNGSQRTVTVADIISTGSITGVVAGTGGLTKAGLGTLNLSGSNTFSGGLSLSAGQLMLGHDAALGTGTFAISGGWFDVTAARTTTNNNPQAWNGDFTFLGSNTLNLGTGTVTLGTTPTVTVSGSTLTVGGPIVGSGYGLTKAGTGTLVLSGSGTYSGPTTINAGQVTASHAFALGDGTGALTVNGGVLSINSVNVTRSGSITLASGTISSGTLTMNGSTLDARSGLVSTNLAGSGGLRKTTSGTVTMSGSNSYNGATTVDSGLLSVTGTSTGSGATTVNGGTLDIALPAGLYGGGTANWTASNITVASGGILSLRVAGSGFSTANMTTLLTNLGATGNAVTNNGFRAGSTIGIDTQNGAFTLADNLRDSTGTGGGAIGLTKYGSSTLTLTGSNTYTGTTTISAGTLALGATGYLVGPIVNDTGLVISNTAVTLPGRITGAGSLATSGTGNVLLSNTSSVLGGPITIPGGRLELAGSLSGSGGIGIGSGALSGTFRYIGSSDSVSSRTITVGGSGGVIDASGSGALNMATGTISATAGVTLTGSSTANNAIGMITGAGVNVNKTGSGLWRLTGASSYSGQLTVSDGTLVVAATVIQTGESPFGTATATASLPSIGNSAAGVSGTAALLIQGGNSVDRGFSVAALGGGSASQVVVLGATGTGTALIGSSGGQIRLGRSVTLQASDSATVRFSALWKDSNGNDDPVVAYTIGSAGNAGVVQLEKLLSGSATGVNIVNGTAQLFENGGEQIAPDTPVTVGSTLGAATLDLNGLSQSLSLLTFAGNSGSVTTGAVANGMLRLVNSGSVSVSGTGHVISSLVDLDVPTTFDTDSASAITVSNVISSTGGAMGLTKTGLGTLTLSGNNTYTGTTSIAAGRLAVNGSLASAVTVAGGATLGGSGRLAGSLTGDGLIAPGNSPGILTVDGQITPTGSTSFAFELTGTGSPAWGSASASVNDVLRLTASDPFTSSLGSGNVVNIYFDRTTLANGDTFLGGFYIDNPLSTPNLLTGELGTATFQYFVKGDGLGSFNYNGTSYYSFEQFAATASGITGVTRSVVNVASADFSSGTITTGQATQFVIIPEPGAMALAGIGIAAAAWAARRRQ